ncbi:MAG: DUF4388 domain-containing protein [Deltaproteobacteria bacterium]|nr:DUF4388 domain-containing protein [Deltaproteobacteria bacterium]
MPGRKIVVIADPDPRNSERLSRIVQNSGYTPVHAAGIESIMESVTLHVPSLLVFDDACASGDVGKVFRAMRTDPAVSHVPIVVLADSMEDDIPYFDRARDSVLLKPYNLDEVSARIRNTLNRLSTPKEDAETLHELKGDIHQVGIPDLLQVFWSNKKSGVLELAGPRGKGKIALYDGAPVNAEAGSVAGEKALFRLLSWRSGRFSFREGEPGGAQTLHGSPEAMIMEGVRQNDELRRIGSTLPALNDYLALSISVDALPLGLHPVTREVASLLDKPMTFEDVLDKTRATDYETVQAVLTLMEGGLLRKIRESAPFRIPLLVESQVVLALKTRIRERYRGQAGRNSLKVILVSTNREMVLEFLGGLASRTGFSRDSRLAAKKDRNAMAIGTVGTLRLDDATNLVLWSAPAEPAFKPLWRPFLDGSIGILFLVEPGRDKGADTLYDAYDYFYGDAGLPAAIVLMGKESGLDEAMAFLDGLPMFEIGKDGSAKALAQICRVAARKGVVRDSNG